MTKYLILSVLTLFSGTTWSYGQSVEMLRKDTNLLLPAKPRPMEYELELSFLAIGTAGSDITAVLNINTLRNIPIKFTDEFGGVVAANGKSISLTFKKEQFPNNGGLQPKSIKKKVSLKLEALTMQDSLLMARLALTGDAPTIISLPNDDVMINFVKAVEETNAKEVKKSPLELFYLNAYNFTLDGALLSNYLGTFNVFDHQIGHSRAGLNAGFTTINYSIGNNDSLTRLFSMKVAPDPLADSIQKGQKYVKQLNRLTTKQQNKSFSIFAQPMLRLFDKNNDKVQIYIHGHLELLINRNTITTTVTTLRSDSIGVNATIPADSSFWRYLPGTYSSSSTFLNGYFGAGVTCYFRPVDSLSIFLQGTIGRTNNYPNVGSVNSPLTGTPVPSGIIQLNPPYTRSGTALPVAATPTSRGGAVTVAPNSWFYYVHGYIAYNVTKGIQGLVGAEIRGLFPAYSPFYAVYAGVNLDIKGIVSGLK